MRAFDSIDASLAGVRTQQSGAFRSFLALAVCGLFAGGVPVGASAEEALALIGGKGGGYFEAHCPANAALAGFELRAADDVDAIRPLCIDAPGSTPSLPPGASDWHGGDGGGPVTIVCPNAAPLVGGLYVDFEGVDTVIVNSIQLYCGAADGASEARPYLEASFEGPPYYNGDFGAAYAERGENTQRCATGRVAVGLHGRSGRWVDAVGLECGAPHATPITSIGRKNTGVVSPPGPPMSLCERAVDARRRNSPAAPDLEAQCEASKTPVKSIGRVPVTSPPGPTMTLCERAADARSRNSPAASNLEAQCAKLGGH